MFINIWGYKQNMMMMMANPLLKPKMRVLDIGCSVAQEAIDTGCKVTVIHPPAEIVVGKIIKKTPSSKMLKIIPKCAYSKHTGYVNPATGEYARWAGNIPLNYRHKEVYQHDYYCLDNYFKCTMVDRMWRWGKIDLMNIDYLALDALMGAKNTINRYKPILLVPETEQTSVMELLKFWNLDYKKMSRINNKILFSSRS
jgi:hypothetical protein